PRLLRPGAVTREALEKATGLSFAPVRREAKKSAAQLAPGMLARHYSPRTPVVLHATLPTRRAAREAWGFLAQPAHARGRNIFWLDRRGNLRGAARRLFAVLRAVDDRGFGKIHVERARGGGLAEAINDRLIRAAAR